MKDTEAIEAIKDILAKLDSTERAATVIDFVRNSIHFDAIAKSKALQDAKQREYLQQAYSGLGSIGRKALNTGSFKPADDVKQ